MSKLFIKEQARKFLKENNLKDSESIANALKDRLQDRKAFCADMKPIYKAVNEESAIESLLEFEEK